MTKLLKVTANVSEPTSMRWSGQQLYFELDGASYVAVHTEGDARHPTNEVSFVTVFVIPACQVVDPVWIETQIQAMIEHDDVFKPSFLAGIILVSQSEPDDLCIAELQSILEPRGCRFCRFLRHSAQISAGPHVLHEGGLRQVYRLYEDYNQAFMTPFIPTRDKSSFQELRAGNGNRLISSIAVPSKFADPGDHALRGARLAVKDLFSLAGQKNTLCSRAYYAICPPAAETSDTISTLMDAGANVIGFTKLSSLISREEPLEAVDFQTAFNPRGDGYQSPAGSSSGSAVSVAAYEWVDFAIGTDTSGSGRRPALVNGVYQFRPSHDLISCKGMIQTFAPWDTPCVFTRDIKRLPDFVRAWYKPAALSPSELKYTIVMPCDYFSDVKNVEQREHIECFIQKFEQWNGSTTERISMVETWAKQPPAAARGLDLKSFLDGLNVRTYYHDFFHSTDIFRQMYHAKFQKAPYVNDFVQCLWEMGRKITYAERDQGMRDLEIYKQWIMQNIIKPTERNALMILPISNVEPNYRNASQSPPPIQTAFDSLYLPPILGGPDIVLPVDQWYYKSRISQVEEALPIAINIVGIPGTDSMFIQDMVRFLQESGYPTQVLPGKTMF